MGIRVSKRKRGNPFRYESFTANINYENLCDGCRETEHDLQTCQSISLRRIAEALEKIAEAK